MSDPDARPPLHETLRMKLWWLRGSLATQVADAMSADPQLDPDSETLEDEIGARLPDLGGRSIGMVVDDVARALRGIQA